MAATPDPRQADDRGQVTVVYFSRPVGPHGWLGKLTSGPTHVAVGDASVVYDPFIVHGHAFHAAIGYVRMMKQHGISLVVVRTPNHPIGHHQCVRFVKCRPMNFWQLAWAVITRKDCVGVTAKLLRGAGVKLPRFVVLPGTLRRCLVKHVTTIHKTGSTHAAQGRDAAASGTAAQCAQASA